MYLLFSFPMMPSKKSEAHPIADSSTSCFFPGFSTLRFRTKMIDNPTSTAMITHVTTTDSATPIPPNIGIVNTVSQFSSSSNFSVKLPVSLPPFLNEADFHDPLRSLPLNTALFQLSAFLPRRKTNFCDTLFLA